MNSDDGSDFQIEMPMVVEIDISGMFGNVAALLGTTMPLFTVPKGKCALVRREGMRLVIEIGQAKERTA